jgi:hypothetical protein
MIDQEAGVVYESPDGGKTIYARTIGSATRTLVSVDELVVKEQQLLDRWKGLKRAVFMDDPVINDLLSKIDVLVELKR